MVLTTDKIPTNEIEKHWDELAVNNVLHLVENDKEVMDFMPDDIKEGKFPDRRWFWGVLFALRQEWATKYLAIVMKIKHGRKENFEKKVVKVSPNWISKLQQHDYRSKRKLIAVQNMTLMFYLQIGEVGAH